MGNVDQLFAFDGSLDFPYFADQTLSQFGVSQLIPNIPNDTLVPFFQATDPAVAPSEMAAPRRI